MQKIGIMFGITLMALVIIDGIWLRFVMAPLYRRYLAHLLADSITIWPALVFYVLYSAGICFFVVHPSLARSEAILSCFLAGFFLGLLAYAAYDLTNLATLRNWPLGLAALDMVWGGILTGLAAVTSVLFTRILIK